MPNNISSDGDLLMSKNATYVKAFDENGIEI
jgi:hypothetical protein